MMQVYDDDTSLSTEHARLPAIIRASCLCLAVSLLLGWRSYFRAHRIFAISPLFPGLGRIPEWTDPILFCAVLAALGWQTAQWRARWPVWFIVAANLYWSMQDLARVQIYIYLYCVVLLLCRLPDGRGAGTFPALRVIVASFYLWAGLQKMNMTFVGVIFPWFVGSWTGPSPGPVMAALVIAGGLIAPIFEALIAPFMLIPRLRYASLVMAVAVITVALACLGPLGRNYNTEVWPMNVYLIFLDFIVLKGFHGPGIGGRLDAKVAIAFILFTVAPILSYFQVSPLLASLKLYSGNLKAGYVRLAPDEDRAWLPKLVAGLVQKDGAISIHDWTIAELGAPALADEIVFHTGPKALCPYLSDPDEAVLRIFGIPDRWTGRRSVQDFPLCEDLRMCVPPAR